MENEKNVNESNVTEETLAGKLAAAEQMIVQMKAEKESMAAEKNKYQEPLKQELTKKIDALPESVKARFAGKELDPVEGLKMVEQAAVEYKAIEAETKAKVKAEIDAYREKLNREYGINIPELNKVMIDVTKTENKDAPRTNMNINDNNVVDVAKKPNLNANEISNITNGFSNMSKWLEDRKK